jgi:hypothetical protein
MRVKVSCSHLLTLSWLWWDLGQTRQQLQRQQQRWHSQVPLLYLQHLRHSSSSASASATEMGQNSSSRSGSVQDHSRDSLLLQQQQHLVAD